MKLATTLLSLAALAAAAHAAPAPLPRPARRPRPALPPVWCVLEWGGGRYRPAYFGPDHSYRAGVRHGPCWSGTWSARGRTLQVTERYGDSGGPAYTWSATFDADFRRGRTPEGVAVRLLPIDEGADRE